MPISNNAKTLEVPDAATLKEFLAQARKSWTTAHLEAVRRRGRPSEEKRVFDACTKIWRQRDGERRLTQGQFIRAVQEKLGAERLHPDTIERHVKEWIRCHLTLDEVPPSYLKKPEVQEACMQLAALSDAWRKHEPAIRSFLASLPPGAKMKDVRRLLDAQRKLPPAIKPRRSSP